MSDAIEPLEVEAVPDVVQPKGAVLSVRNLRVDFATDDGVVKAVDDVSYDVFENEVLGIVGESGSGKTVSSLAVLGLLPKTAKISGQIVYRGKSLLGLGEREMREFRGNKVAMVFQDALAALNPVFTVGHQISEAIQVHRDLGKRELESEVHELLSIVGIPNPNDRADQYPHEFSGGMRQRAMIAMSLANRPDVLIADEPTTALDVTIQAQVLEVFERIQEQTNSAIILITHDLGVVAGMADRVMVMYAGRQAEIGTVDEIFYEPRHPYTLSLLASLPRVDRGSRGERLYRIKGQPPSLIRVPPGCPFHPRCPLAFDRCRGEVPPPYDLGDGHRAACFLAEPGAAAEAPRG
jgi:peptide/nickel transport system ATP-binding protein